MFPVLTAYLSYILSGTTVNRFWYRCGTRLKGIFCEHKRHFPKDLIPFEPIAREGSHRCRGTLPSRSELAFLAISKSGGQTVVSRHSTSGMDDLVQDSCERVTTTFVKT